MLFCCIYIATYFVFLCCAVCSMFALYYIVLYCVVLYCIALYCIELCTVACCIKLYLKDLISTAIKPFVPDNFTP